jgi:hypothetical protein
MRAAPAVRPVRSDNGSSNKQQEGPFQLPACFLVKEEQPGRRRTGPSAVWAARRPDRIPLPTQKRNGFEDTRARRSARAGNRKEALCTLKFEPADTARLLTCIASHPRRSRSDTPYPSRTVSNGKQDLAPKHQRHGKKPRSSGIPISVSSVSSVVNLTLYQKCLNLRHCGTEAEPGKGLI